MPGVVVAVICFTLVGASFYAFFRYFQVGPSYFLNNLRNIRSSLSEPPHPVTGSHTDAETRTEFHRD